MENMMKDRIRDIALDCMVRYINDGDAWSFTTDELEKFGETIVRECCKVMDDTAKEAKENFTYMGDDVPTSVHQIKILKHFGVEE